MFDDLFCLKKLLEDCEAKDRFGRIERMMKNETENEIENFQKLLKTNWWTTLLLFEDLSLIWALQIWMKMKQSYFQNWKKI